ncbi:pe38 [Choristoneura fumiferana multiple nucleopolyhedrovirus]|uniref:Pe38 n=1 Tax=Choristoneura fumiferana nuclear polyhedrosis virus TaxID=208973 RepID=Q8QME3_NPVCF|nr:pe38 [Choristoneura fumiferana multiple nucleopolyhedrovirus]AAA67993.1 pe38 [Choristoneura fumiferana multiple nucleopolyhedrovirus]
MYRRYTPYYRHVIRNDNERQAVQERLLLSFNEKPVTPLSATCAVCYETYVMQSDNIVEFMMPSTCTHMFCYKCVLGLYRNAEVHAEMPRVGIGCPLCQKTVTAWRSFFPNAVVTCKFTKKTTDVPVCQQFCDAVGILNKRYAALPGDIPNNEVELREQLNRVQEEKAAELQRMKAAHDAAWESSCRQIASLQKRVTSLETKNEKLQRQNQEYDEAICVNHLEKKRLQSQKEERDGASAKTIADLTQTVERLKSELASKSAVTVEFNRNTDTPLYQRFNALLDSTFENMMLKDRIINLRKEVFGAACVPCRVDININCNDNNVNNDDDDDLILIEDHHDTITIDD